MDFSPETDQEKRRMEEPAESGREQTERELPGESGENPEDRKRLAQEKCRAFAERQQQEQAVRRGGFAAGFLSGMLAVFGCAVLAWLVFWAKESGYFGAGSDKTEAVDAQTEGAELLTDRETLQLLEDVQEIIAEEYLEDADGEQLVGYLFKGIAAGLDDPYASYYTKKELQSVMDESRGAYVGIGATLMQNTMTGEICCTQVYAGNPAAEAGMREGDILRTVDGLAVDGMNLTDLVWIIKGMEEEFSVEVYRPDTEEELTLTLQCREIVVQHVEYEMLENGIGYIRIAEFSESAVGQFSDAVEDLNAQGMEKLIVDLRNNPGGLLNSVCDILDEILPGGLIVYTENKNGDREEYEADGEYRVDCEVAVLVNGYSASASEIFAGAIQDYELGPVIGTKTYGKGVVQKTFPLSDGSAFKLTVEKYFTPKGQDIDGSGITPDIVVEEDGGADGQDETETEQPNQDETEPEQSGRDETETEQSGQDETEPEQSGQDAQEESVESDAVLERAIEELSR